VIIRKNSYGNRSPLGDACQAVLTSIFRTLKQRGHDLIRTIVHALTQSLTTAHCHHCPNPNLLQWAEVLRAAQDVAMVQAAQAS